MGASVGRRVAVASEVEFRCLAISKFHKKGDVGVSIPAGGTRGREITFVAVLAPVDGYSASGCIGGFGNKAANKKEKVCSRLEKIYVSHVLVNNVLSSSWLCVCLLLLNFYCFFLRTSLILSMCSYIFIIKVSHTHCMTLVGLSFFSPQIITHYDLN